MSVFGWHHVSKWNKIKSTNSCRVVYFSWVDHLWLDTRSKLGEHSKFWNSVQILKYWNPRRCEERSGIWSQGEGKGCKVSVAGGRWWGFRKAMIFLWSTVIYVTSDVFQCDKNGKCESLLNWAKYCKHQRYMPDLPKLLLPTVLFTSRLLLLVWIILFVHPSRGERFFCCFFSRLSGNIAI